MGKRDCDNKGKEKSKWKKTETRRKAGSREPKPKHKLSKHNLLNIIYTNADVLTNAKIQELRNVINIDKPDIIAISEVKPKNYRRLPTLAEYQIKGFDIESEYLDDKNVGRGLIIYVHESIKYSKIEVSKIPGIGVAPTEMLIC